MTQGEKKEDVERDRALVVSPSADDIQSGVRFQSTHDRILFVTAVVSGYTKTPPPADNSAFELSRSLYDIDGEPVAGTQFNVGDLLLVHLELRAGEDIPDALLVDLLPAGFELENPNFKHSLKIDNTDLENIKSPASLCGGIAATLRCCTRNTGTTGTWPLCVWVKIRPCTCSTWCGWSAPAISRCRRSLSNPCTGPKSGALAALRCRSGFSVRVTESRRTAKVRGRFRPAAPAAAAVLLAVAAFLWLDLIYPLPLPETREDFAVVVTAEDGSPLRGFPDENGVWRYPVRPRDVSPLYLEALVNYEDRWFWRHPGVNPWALARAAWLYARHGRMVSGGSTLTMQAARIIDPHSRSVPGKLKQIFRALQLEYHLDKNDLLALYLNYAPFGGPVEGVEAASYSYLGKSARELSHAEAALLAVLPQAPSRLRPDRHPDAAQAARDKVLDRLERFGVWDRETIQQAKLERTAARFDPRPMTAPLLARRLRGRADPEAPLRTCLDLAIQQTAADLTAGWVRPLPEHTSAAVLVVENKTMAVRAYVGSADFLDDSRYGHVDMVQARRSPGSTLKPFLYAYALEEGLVHSESLLVDAPLFLAGYNPGNFSEGFSGPVSVSEALSRSLNVPAVDLLDRLGPAFFDARLRQGGLSLKYPPGGRPNLAMILGGVGASLEDLTAAYTSLAREGLSGRLRFTPDDPLVERRMTSPGAAYIIRRILQEQQRPDLPGGRLTLNRSRQTAWKTGTSYGHRDAWAVGVTDRYTVGVWVGRPDGTPSPGQYGRVTAAPLLMAVIDSLPRSSGPPPPRPEAVDQIDVCWPLGVAPRGDDDPFCQERRTAFILNGAIPPTLPDRADRNWLPNPLKISVNPDTGLRVEADCRVERTVEVLIARWPKAAGPWLSPHLKNKSRVPPLDPACRRPVAAAPDSVAIIGLEPDMIIRPQGAETVLPTVALEALGGRGGLFWLLDGELIAQAGVGQSRLYHFRRPGRFRLTVMDQAGNHDSIEVEVKAGDSRGG